MIPIVYAAILSPRLGLDSSVSGSEPARPPSNTASLTQAAILAYHIFPVLVTAAQWILTRFYAALLHSLPTTWKGTEAVSAQPRPQSKSKQGTLAATPAPSQLEHQQLSAASSPAAAAAASSAAHPDAGPEPALEAAAAAASHFTSQLAYGFALAASAIPHAIAFSLSLTAAVAPALFSSGSQPYPFGDSTAVKGTVTADFLLPATWLVPRLRAGPVRSQLLGSSGSNPSPSFAPTLPPAGEGALRFLQWDDLVSGSAFLLWALILRVRAQVSVTTPLTTTATVKDTAVGAGTGVLDESQKKNEKEAADADADADATGKKRARPSSSSPHDAGVSPTADAAVAALATAARRGSLSSSSSSALSSPASASSPSAFDVALAYTLVGAKAVVLAVLLGPAGAAALLLRERDALVRKRFETSSSASAAAGAGAAAAAANADWGTAGVGRGAGGGSAGRKGAAAAAIAGDEELRREIIAAGGAKTGGLFLGDGWEMFLATAFVLGVVAFCVRFPVFQRLIE